LIAIILLSNCIKIESLVSAVSKTTKTNNTQFVCAQRIAARDFNRVGEKISFFLSIQYTVTAHVIVCCKNAHNCAYSIYRDSGRRACAHKAGLLSRTLTTSSAFGPPVLVDGKKSSDVLLERFAVNVEVV
jgi:hypothetical protein